MHVRVSHQSQCGLYQRTNQTACRKIRWYLYQSADMSDYCSLSSQTFYGLLFSYLPMTDVTSHVHHKFPVCFLLYITTKKTCLIKQIVTVNNDDNAPISETYSSQKNNSCTPCVPMFQERGQYIESCRRKNASGYQGK